MENEKKGILSLTEMPEGFKNLIKNNDIKCLICEIMMSEHPMELFAEHVALGLMLSSK